MEKYVKDLVVRIEKNIIKGFLGKSNRLEQACFYALSVKGKRLRPLLFLSLLDALGEKPDLYMDIACAIEYIHTYSLIHDDLPAMDNDDFRRGQPTVHVKFDEPIALLTGDTLLTVAFERIAKSNLEAEKIVNILKILTESIGVRGMASGQALDIDFDGDRNKILKIQKKKTAYLISGCLLCAGEIGGLDIKKMAKLKDAGLSIGIAFQMADDLLDIEGDEKEVGKKLKKDERNKSPNSVIYFGKKNIKNKINDYYNKTVGILKEMRIDFLPFLNLIKKMAFRNK